MRKNRALKNEEISTGMSVVWGGGLSWHGHPVREFGCAALPSAVQGSRMLPPLSRAGSPCYLSTGARIKIRYPNLTCGTEI